MRGALAAAGERPLDAIEVRVAASVAHLGLVARIIAAGLAVTALTDQFLVADLHSMWWQDELRGPYPLSIAVSPQPSSLIGGPVRSLTEAVGQLVSVSDQVLWGNVASAINSAATIIVARRPELTQRVVALATTMLDQTPHQAPNPDLGAAFRRGSCCLIYRASPAPALRTGQDLCGDCVLRT